MAIEDPGGAQASRRSFMRRFAGAAAAAAAGPLPGAVVAGDLYVNHRIGLAFRKPPGWRFEHLQTFADIRNEYDYATPDPALAQELKKGQLPVVVVSAAPVIRTLCGSMTVGAEQNFLRPGEVPAHAEQDLVQGISSIVRDFRLLGRPFACRVAGRDALDLRFTFHYEDKLGHSGPVRHRTLVVLNAPLLFTFNMLDIPAVGIDSQSEFDGICASLVFA